MEKKPEYLEWWGKLGRFEQHRLMRKYGPYPKLVDDDIGLHPDDIKDIREKELGMMEKKFTAEEVKEIAKKMFWLGANNAASEFDERDTGFDKEDIEKFTKTFEDSVFLLLNEPINTIFIRKESDLCGQAMHYINGDSDKEIIRIVLNGILVNEFWDEKFSEFTYSNFIPPGKHFTTEVDDKGIHIKIY